MNRCPSQDQLARLLAEGQGAAERGPLEEHVEQCSSCQEALEQLTASGAPTVVPGSDEQPADAETSPFLARLQGQPEPAVALRRVACSAPDATPRPGTGRGTHPRNAARTYGLPQVPGYEVLGLLGRGGMGVVYKARHLRLRRLVALKLIADRAQFDPDYLARFRIEAEAVARLQHPNVVQIYEVGEAGGTPYLALELVEGGSLADHTRRSPQPPAEAGRLTAILARAVHHAHRQGVVHRDLKPANILLRGEGRGPQGEREDLSSLAPPPSPLASVPKITDFGLAKRIDLGPEATQVPTLTEAGGIIGSPGYMAPEMAEPRGTPVGPAADIYGLGAILYELLTGRPPFLGGTALESVRQTLFDEPVPPRRLRRSVPRDLETICLRCLHKDPARRYASAEALADDLDRFLAGEPIRARPTGRLERAARWARRRPAAAALVALGLLGVLLGLGLTAWQWHAERQARLEQKVQDAARLTRVLREFQQLYSSEVVDRLKPLGVKMSHEYTTQKGTVPLPPTLTMELARRLASTDAALIRIYSDHPFPSRKDRPASDAFEREALGALRRQPDRPFYRFEDWQGRRVLRYTTADVMQASCVTCHNTHPASPKTDWKVGDVRGALEIILPVD